MVLLVKVIMLVGVVPPALLYDLMQICDLILCMDKLVAHLIVLILPVYTLLTLHFAKIKLNFRKNNHDNTYLRAFQR